MLSSKWIISIFVVLFWFDISANDNAKIDSLKHIVDTHPDDSVVVRSIVRWDDIIYYDNPDLDQELNQKIIEIGNRNLSKNLSASRKRFFQEQLLSANNIVGINLDTKGSYYEALNYYYEALKYARALDLQIRIGAISNNIGLVHELQGNLEKAEEFYIVAEEIAIEYGDTVGVISSKNNLGSLYSTMKKFEVSESKYRQAIDIARNADIRQQYASSLQNLGVLYEVLEEYDSALFYYQKCIEICELDAIYWDEHSKALYNTGSIYYQLTPPENDKAIRFCRMGYSMAKAYSAKQTIESCANCLYEAYRKDNQTDSALKYLEIATQIGDSLRDKDQSIQIAQKESEFEYQQKLSADSIQKAQDKEITDAIIAKEKAEREKQTERNYYLVAGLILLAIFGFVIYSRLQITKRQKEIIAQQKRASDKQKEIISEQHNEITDSINYAEMIQNAVLPTVNIKSINENSFVLFQPKDVVSGDFYWLEKNEEFDFYCVADCTGHGIPGAFISMIGTMLLNEIYNSKKIYAPNLVLDELNRLVPMILTDKHGHTMRDGMDISFIRFEKSTRTLEFSGANNPVWIISQSPSLQNGSTTLNPNIEGDSSNLFEIKGDSKPIGKADRNKSPFVLNKIILNHGDRFLIFSDGFADQFGGPKGKKYKYKPMKRFFLANAALNSDELKSAFLKEFHEWKGGYDQLDDVCMIGGTIA